MMGDESNYHSATISYLSRIAKALEKIAEQLEKIRESEEEESEWRLLKNKQKS